MPCGLAVCFRGGLAGCDGLDEELPDGEPPDELDGELLPPLEGDDDELPPDDGDDPEPDDAG